MDMPASLRPWTSRHKCLGVVSERGQELLDLCYYKARKDYPEIPEGELCDRLWANPGMSNSRLPFSLDFAPCFASSCVPYSFGMDMALSGANQLRVLGWSPRDIHFEFFSDVDLKSLSADAYSVPISSLLVAGLWLNPHAPWWR